MAAAPGERLAHATASSPREQARTLGCAYAGYAPENRGTLVAPEGTVPSVAQPSVRHDLGARVAQVRWTSTAYLPTLAALQCHRRGRSAARGRAGRARGPAFRVRAERSDRPRDRRPRPRRAGAHAGPDRPALTGAALPAAAPAVLVHALAGAPALGWTGPPTLLGLGGSAAFAAVLVRYTNGGPQPLVPAAVARFGQSRPRRPC